MVVFRPPFLTPGNLINWPETCIQLLKQRIEVLMFGLLEKFLRQDDRPRSFKLLMDSWANINRSGNYNIVHTHPNCMWSGVYYVAKGKPDKSMPYNGLLELLDPREAANYIQIQNTIFDARTFYREQAGVYGFISWLGEAYGASLYWHRGSYLNCI